MTTTHRLQRSGRRRSVAGFTLTELLTVLAILVLLVGLLLTALNRAHQRADSATCMNGTRQVVLAWVMYSHDANRLVPNVDGLLGGLTNWVAGNMTSAEERTNTALLIDGRRSLLATYLSDPRVFKCPAEESDNSRSISLNSRLNPVRYNGVSARWVGGLGRAFKTFRAISDIDNPSSTFVTIEENPLINDAYFAVDLSNTGSPDGEGTSQPYWLIDYPANNHASSANVSFADGHVESHRWQESDTTTRLTPITRFPDSSRDARWVQEHCSNR